MTKRAIIKSTWDKSGKWLQDIWIDNHHVLVDEPKKIGGLDLAPTPMDYLKVALASCTSMTIKFFCDREGWNLEDISVTCEINKGVIERDITLVGDLTEEQKSVILKIADRCPVHKIIEGDNTFKTNIV